LSNLGDGLRVVAVPLLATTLTDDPVLISGLVVASYLPWVLFGLPIGTLVDRGRPEVFMRSANIARAVVLIVLTVALAADLGSIWLLFGAAFAVGVGEAFYDNAAQSLVPRIVDDKQLESANGTLITLERLGQDLVGPAVAGVLFGVSSMLPFGLNAAGLLIAVALLLGVRTQALPARDLGVPFQNVGRETIEGMRWLWNTTLVRRLILTGAALTFATMFWESTLVLLVLGPLDVSPAGYGLILALGAVGGVLGALVTPRLIRRFNRRPMQLTSLALCAAVVLALAAYPSPVTAAVAWGGTGFAFTLWSVVSISTRQRLVPSDTLARVNSAARTISMSAAPLGALAGGVAAKHAGLRAPIWVSAGLLMVLLVVFAAQSRDDDDLLTAQHA